ncbi:hypothetical protein QQ008_13785 [Fulvivirgaceae bacterium BMA10]|uniref:Uncharacterized protein n=1 Tax=Splendidivirga corallicola TaxID=3051826 RepID=A0ABT8KNX3_9BACT|nr:hypothetical protein [Fulvivirgaceae bacterium BMA10]
MQLVFIKGSPMLPKPQIDFDLVSINFKKSNSTVPSGILTVQGIFKTALPNPKISIAGLVQAAFTRCYF